MSSSGTGRDASQVRRTAALSASVQHQRPHDSVTNKRGTKGKPEATPTVTPRQLARWKALYGARRSRGCICVASPRNSTSLGTPLRKWVSAESPRWSTRLDKIKNFHSTDTMDTENSGTRGRPIWVHSSQVGKADSKWVCHVVLAYPNVSRGPMNGSSPLEVRVGAVEGRAHICLTS